MSAAPAARPVGSAEPPAAIGAVRLLGSRTATLCLLELAKLRHDRTELYTRAVQPALWLLVFGETFTRIHAIPTPSRLPYLDYLAPGIMAQSALFIAIFYGIQLIWERDFGILTKLLATPTPRAALVAGKAFAAGVRAVSQVVVVMVLASVLGVRFIWQPLHLLGAVAAVMLGSSFFASLSMTIAGWCAAASGSWGPARPSPCRCSSPPTPCTRPRSCPPGCGPSPTPTRSATRSTPSAGCCSACRAT